MNILVLDDEKEIADLVEVYLKNEDYNVYKFYDSEDAIRCINTEKIDIATNTLSSIERGNAFMTAPTLEKIIEVLNVTPKDLFSFDEDLENEDMYASILKNLEFIKNDKERLKMFYNFAKSLI